VSVGAEHEARDPGVAQDGRDRIGFGWVVELPARALGEPAPNRRMQSRRMKVNVNVDHGEAARFSGA
jgi:hypothetical protein